MTGNPDCGTEPLRNLDCLETIIQADSPLYELAQQDGIPRIHLVVFKIHWKAISSQMTLPAAEISVSIITDSAQGS